MLGIGLSLWPFSKGGLNLPNLLTKTEQFDNAAWGVVGLTAVTPNTWTPPGATLTGDTITEDTTTGNHYITQATALIQTNAAMTVSIHAQQGTGRFLKIQAGNPGFTDAIQAQFDLQLGTVIGSGNAGTGSGATGQIVAMSGGAYRCILSGTPSTSAANTIIVYQCANALNVTSYAGTSRTWNIWGAMVNAGLVPANYIAVP